MSSGFSRRSFLKKSAGLAGLAAAGAFRGPLILAGEPSGPAKLRCAVVGANGQGGASVGAALGERVVALVDVDDRRLAQKMAEVEKRQPGIPVKAITGTPDLIRMRRKRRGKPHSTRGRPHRADSPPGGPQRT